jgi:hypothetical protein
MTTYRLRLLARRILGCIALFAPLPVLGVEARAQTRGGTITGMVRDSVSVPIASADIMLRPGGQRTRTDSAGRFTFTGLDPNSYTVVARKVGFLPETWDVKLAGSSRMDITIVLGRQIPTLDTMVTRASRDCPQFSYEAFLCRRGWQGGIFLDDAAITDQDVIYVGQLFHDMPVFRVDFHLDTDGRAYTLRTTRSWGCIKTLVNGHPYGIPPRYTSSLIALEVYPRGDRVPRELERYTMPDSGITKSGPCTLIVYWTDQSPRPPKGGRVPPA